MERRESRNNFSYQDVPEHQTGLTSSIGGLWPPERASFGRIKGIYTPSIIGNVEGIGIIAKELEVQAASHFFQNNPEITRISLRGIVDSNELRKATFVIEPFIEAIISLAGTQPVFKNCALVYFGLNHPQRQSLPEEIEEWRRNLQKALNTERRQPMTSLGRVIDNGYKVGIIPSEVSEKEIDEIIGLYSRFGWSREEVIEILNNPNNIIAVAYDGNVVSAGIAELGQIPIGGHVLRVAEITEAATAKDYMGQGLYTAISNLLLLEITRRSKLRQILGGEIDLVYGECNGNALGVLKTACIQGRTFSTLVGNDYGFPKSGILHQHVPISGPPRKTSYNDLFPSFIVKNTLYRYFGGEG